MWQRLKLLQQTSRGNMMMVVLFATAMSFVLIGMLSVSHAYRSTLRDSGREFANYQTYKAVTELACYGYVSDLQAQFVTIDAGDAWLSVSGAARYTQALDAAREAITTAGPPRVWRKTDVSEIVSSVGVADPGVLINMNALLSRGTFEIEVVPDTAMDLDWKDDETWVARNEGHVALEPFEVYVNLSARNEKLSETFLVDGIYLDMVKDSEGVISFSFGLSQEGDVLKIERKTEI